MAQVKGRLVKPPTVFMDGVTFDIDGDSGAWSGRLELPIGGAVQAGQTYRVELADGRAGEIRVTAYNEISTQGLFEGVGPLA